MNVCRVGGRTRTPVTTHAGPRLEARRTDSGGFVAVAHPSNNTVPASSSRRVLQCRCNREQRVQMIYSTHRLLPVLCCWAPHLRAVQSLTVNSLTHGRPEAKMSF